MKKNLISIVAIAFTAIAFVGCNNSSLSSAEVNNLVAGPNSIKGTISGTTLDNTAYSFDYDYHVTTNDANSYSESWIQDNDSNYDGDSILYVWQYFYVDQNGYNDYGDEWSSSGRYVVLEMNIDIHTMKLMPIDYSNYYLRGMWQNITSGGNRFVYAFTFNSSSESGTYDVTGLSYDKNSQILSGKVKIDLPNNDTNYNQYNNHNATTITGDFKIYVPKEHFQVTNKGTNSGMVYRKR